MGCDINKGKDKTRSRHRVLQSAKVLFSRADGLSTKKIALFRRPGRQDTNTNHNDKASFGWKIDQGRS
jgi:hypothetical protein